MTVGLSSVVAPGKLILIGEYAVRHDGPAVVMAVDREARLDWCDPDARAGSAGAATASSTGGSSGRMSTPPSGWTPSPSCRLAVKKPPT